MKRRRPAETWEQTFEQVMRSEQAPPSLATCRDAGSDGLASARFEAARPEGVNNGRSQAANRRGLGLYFAGILPISALVPNRI
jgi:hypothetical protein